MRVNRFTCQQERGRKEGDVDTREGDGLRYLRSWEIGCRAPEKGSLQRRGGLFCSGGMAGHSGDLAGLGAELCA